MQEATFGAGCFWGVELKFRQTAGVIDAAVGYCGGTTQNPTYQDVCTGTTGHAEVVHLQFDPDTISYEELLNVFFNCHNPTTRNRQGPDFGTQYRSVIFYHTPEQRQMAEKVKSQIDQTDRWENPIVTEISPVAEFYRGEEYHQQYLEKRGRTNCH